MTEKAWVKSMSEKLTISLEIPAECAVDYLLKYIWEWGSRSDAGKAAECFPWYKTWSSGSEGEPACMPQKFLIYYY